MVSTPVPTPALALLHQDDHLLAVAKPSGLLTHRGWGDDAEVAVDLARALCGRWVYPVHRLDRGTSGILLFALDAETAARMQRQFEEGAIAKRYLALVRGRAPEEGLIDHPLPRDEAPDARRVAAVTGFRRLHVVEDVALDDTPGARRVCYSWVEAHPRTGRLHQVRRHLKHLGHPLIGDVNYGRGEHNRLFRTRYGLHRLALHASAVALPHPRTGELLRLDAPLPADLEEPLRLLGIPDDVLSAPAAREIAP